MSRSPQELGDGQARDLLRRAKALDEGALDWIYRAYADRAYRYVLSRTGDQELADDGVGAGRHAHPPAQAHEVDVPHPQVGLARAGRALDGQTGAVERDRQALADDRLPLS